MCHQDLITTWIGVEDYIKGRVSRQDNYEQPSELLKMGANIGIDSFGNLIGADASPYLHHAGEGYDGGKYNQADIVFCSTLIYWKYLPTGIHDGRYDGCRI